MSILGLQEGLVITIVLTKLDGKPSGGFTCWATQSEEILRKKFSSAVLTRAN